MPLIRPLDPSPSVCEDGWSRPTGLIRRRRSIVCGLLLLVALGAATPVLASDRAVAVAGPAAPATATAPHLAARGDRSGFVAVVQSALMASGLELVGGSDGVFGRYTEGAVRSFQTAHGLTADGIVGPATASTLGLNDWGTVTLERGARGSIVAVVQAALMASGLELVGGSDGVFGRYTEGAVRSFQTAHGLTADGIVGPVTATSLGLGSWEGIVPVEEPGSGAGGSGPVFPTRPTCTFSDTFGAPRPGGRTHEGVDILAPQGTPVVAMYPGTITKITLASSGSIAGNALRLTLADGTYVFYAHLDAFSAAAVVGTTVAAGVELGTVGRTGNASSPHLHLELHPGGGSAIDPYPLVRGLVDCT